MHPPALPDFAGLPVEMPAPGPVVEVHSSLGPHRVCRCARLARGLSLCLNRRRNGTLRLFLACKKMHVYCYEQDHDTKDKNRFTYLHLVSP